VTLPTGITSISDDIQNKICHQIWNRTNGTISVLIQMYGNLYDSSSITVCNGKTLQGDEWTFDKSSDYPDVNVYMQSYFLTGSLTSWVLFNDTNYNGTFTCLAGLKGENGKWEMDSGKCGKLPPSHFVVLVGKWEIVVKWENGAKRTY